MERAPGMWCGGVKGWFVEAIVEGGTLHPTSQLLPFISPSEFSCNTNPHIIH